MKAEEFEAMRSSGVAPCGCAVTFGRDLNGAEQRECLHGEDCAAKKKPAPKAAKK